MKPDDGEDLEDSQEEKEATIEHKTALEKATSTSTF